MTQLNFGTSYGMSSPSNSTFQHTHKLEDYDSETDITDAESIHPISPPLRKMKRSSSSGYDAPLMELPRSNIAETRHRTEFRPELDVPKVRSHDAGFNRIRQIKDEDLFCITKTKSESEDLVIGECNKQERTDNYTYTQSIDEALSPSAAGYTLQARRPKRESSPKNFKVEKSTTRKRVPHDRSQGPSMTKSAVDYRERKVLEQQYRKHLATLLDIDIVKQVDDEGGITPLGRLYKATVRMLERNKEERETRIVLVPDIKVDEDEVFDTEFERMRQRALKAEGAYEHLKSNLEALLKHS